MITKIIAKVILRHEFLQLLTKEFLIMLGKNNIGDLKTTKIRENKGEVAN
jgi:hypothetical protein